MGWDNMDVLEQRQLARTIKRLKGENGWDVVLITPDGDTKYYANQLNYLTSELFFVPDELSPRHLAVPAGLFHRDDIYRVGWYLQDWPFGNG